MDQGTSPELYIIGLNSDSVAYHIIQNVIVKIHKVLIVKSIKWQK